MNIPFKITSGSRQTYRIRNTSDETVDLVTVTVDHPKGLTRNLPHEETFGPGASREFMVLGTMQTGMPVEVRPPHALRPSSAPEALNPCRTG